MNLQRSTKYVGVTLLAFLATATGQAEEDLSGTYVYLQETTSVTKMPILSDVVATTRAISIQKLAHEDDWLKGTGTLCDVHMTTTSKLIKTTLPSSFREAIPPVKTQAKLTKKGAALLFTQAPQTLVLGAKLKNPADDPLPEDPNDPRVMDDDKDGKPGVTVRVSGIVSGEIYLVQRSTSRLSGHSTPSGFHGRIDFTNEQKILDASRKVLRRDPEARPDPSRSQFHLTKVSDSVTCEQALELAKKW